MKRFFKTLIGLSIAALAITLISCSQPTGRNSDTGNGGITPSAPQETPIEKAFKELSVSPEKVFKQTNKVMLQTTTSVSGVTITWTASPEGYIETAGSDIGKIKKRDTEDKSITLTATAVKDGENKTKTFTVVVCAENTEPSAQDFAASLAIPSFVSSDMPLPKTVDGYTDATITWESADESIIKMEDDGSGPKGSIVLDIVDRKVKLTATVSYRGNTGTKNFDVTVGHVEEISPNPYDKYQFTGTEFISTEWYEGAIDEGYKYRYADVKTDSAGIKSAVFTRIADYRNGKWMTKQDIQAFINRALNDLKTLKNANSLTLSDFKTVMSALSGRDVTEDKDIFNAINKLPYHITPDTYEEFAELNEQEKTAKLKEYIPFMEKEADNDLIWTDNKFSPAPYSYSFIKKDENIIFQANVLYDSGKPWYKQDGEYACDETFELNPPNPVSIMSVCLYEKKRFLNIYELWIDFIKVTGSSGDKYHGEISYPALPPETINATLKNSPDETATVTITVNGDTMSASVKTGSDSEKTYILHFKGYELH